MAGIGEEIQERLRRWTLELGGPGTRERLEKLTPPRNEYGVDPYGFDVDYLQAAAAPVLWLYRKYFRVKAFGLENVPNEGPVLLVGNHSGQLPFDAAMVEAACLVDKDPPRAVRALVDKWVPTLPFVSTLFARCGQIVGTPENCRRLLSAGEALLVFPEGTRGLNKPFSQRYQLQGFGLGFMRLALENDVPIVPVGVVGAEEQAPAIFDLQPLAGCSLPPLPHHPHRAAPPDAGALPDLVRRAHALHRACRRRGRGAGGQGGPGARRDGGAARPRDLRAGARVLVSPMPASVAITGIAGNLGRELARILHGETRVVGFDRRPLRDRPKDVEHHQLDIRKARVEDVFRRGGIEAIAHLGLKHDPRDDAAEAHSFNVAGTQKLLDIAARHGVKKVVLLSSANVYGPAPGNPNFLPEETPLLGAARLPGYRDLIEVDMYAQSFMWQHPEIETVILRPVNIVGPTVRNAPSNYLRLERPITVLGFDPMIQVIHEEDVCRAIALALRPGVRGVYNVTGPGEVPLSAALRELGREPLPLPHFLVRPVVKRLFDARLSSYPPGEVDYIQYLCAVDGSRFIRDTGWTPAPLHPRDLAERPEQPLTARAGRVGSPPSPRVLSCGRPRRREVSMLLRPQLLVAAALLSAACFSTPPGRPLAMRPPELLSAPAPSFTRQGEIQLHPVRHRRLERGLGRPQRARTCGEPDPDRRGALGRHHPGPRRSCSTRETGASPARESTSG